MTTSTQTQLRRGTKTQVAGMTPAVGEPVANTTDKRMHLGDGSTAGGVPHVNAIDQQNGTFICPTVGGTANAITLTNAFPKTAIAADQAGRFKAGATNTTAVTIQEDGIGSPINAKKWSGGALVSLSPGDIVSGCYYDYVFDGTQYQIQGVDLANSGVTAGTYSSPSSMTVDAKGRVTSITSGTGSIPTALGVGATILATCSVSINADATISASNLIIKKINSGGTSFASGTDTLTGTWKALQTTTSPNEGGEFVRTV